MNVKRAAALAVLATGCGRVAFDPRVDAGDVAAADAAIPVCHTGTWSTPKILSGTPTGSEEADPALSPDELTLYFESNRVPGQGRAIWRATRSTPAAGFGAPQYVSELDTAADERDPEISDDGLRIYLTADFAGVTWIGTATRSTPTGTFGMIERLDILGETTATTYTAFVSPDQLTLYYSRDLELAIATRASTADRFTYVRELDELNSPQTDLDPTVTADGLEIFFGSYRTGPGAIFHSTRPTTNDAFAVASELPQLAGAGGAGAPEISRDGRTLYFWQSNSNQLDLYASTRTCD